MELTILIPCLNEQKTIGECIKAGQSFLRDYGIDGEVLVADNGSTDDSVKIATELGARVTNVKQRGYGAALIQGTKVAKGKYIIMGDADCSYDLYHLDGFMNKLRNGVDLCMGNRFAGGIERGAMPFLHKYLGTPVISFIGRFLYHNRIGDYNCGLRGYNRKRILDLRLSAPGMEYASEMIVKAAKAGYIIDEVPTTLAKDKRDRAPYLNTWSDGVRHLKVLLRNCR